MADEPISRREFWELLEQADRDALQQLAERCGPLRFVAGWRGPGPAIGYPAHPDDFRRGKVRGST